MILTMYLIGFYLSFLLLNIHCSMPRYGKIYRNRHRNYRYSPGGSNIRNQEVGHNLLQSNSRDLNSQDAYSSLYSLSLNNIEETYSRTDMNHSDNTLSATSHVSSTSVQDDTEEVEIRTSDTGQISQSSSLVLEDSQQPEPSTAFPILISILQSVEPIPIRPISEQSSSSQHFPEQPIQSQQFSNASQPDILWEIITAPLQQQFSADLIIQNNEVSSSTPEYFSMSNLTPEAA
ncbi:hypothetical protein CWI38_0157p0010 [Hamiltosporidium tvaerminnensis]|uniref:Uncharacterized protein n=1 Tax=Hamiltosporidium tvaerminnensis TaxID=1176355 RepID=A0A4V2JY70_9MICR|nr:hypothetical protein CWI38_0157p0010 [Hamiltosporidium tvaerminnensis]